MPAAARGAVANKTGARLYSYGFPAGAAVTIKKLDTADNGPGHKRTAYKIVVAQLIVSLAIAGLLLIFAGARSAYSALVGGMVGVIPGFYLAVRVFNLRPGTPAISVLQTFYLGETVKILLTVALMLMAILVLDVNLLVAFLVYLATVSVYWFALLFPEPGLDNLKKSDWST
jgi:ATP synthase protein I